MTTTPSFPTFAPRGPQELGLSYGSRALRFLLDTELTGLLPDEALLQADAAAMIAVAPREMPEAALERISATRHLIALALKRRREAQALQAVMAPRPSADGTGDWGRKVPVTPTRPSRPPQAQIVVPMLMDPL